MGENRIRLTVDQVADRFWERFDIPLGLTQSFLESWKATFWRYMIHKMDEYEEEEYWVEDVRKIGLNYDLSLKASTGENLVAHISKDIDLDRKTIRLLLDGLVELLGDDGDIVEFPPLGTIYNYPSGRTLVLPVYDF